MLEAFTLLLPIIAYDLLSMRRIHRATALAGAWVICIELLSLPVSHTVAGTGSHPSSPGGLPWQVGSKRSLNTPASFGLM